MGRMGFEPTTFPVLITFRLSAERSSQAELPAQPFKICPLFKFVKTSCRDLAESEDYLTPYDIRILYYCHCMNEQCDKCEKEVYGAYHCISCCADLNTREELHQHLDDCNDAVFLNPLQED